MNRLRLLIRVVAGLAIATTVALPPPASAFSTDGRCFGLMVQTATIELRPGFWEAAATHTLAVRYVDPMFELDEQAAPVTFTVDASTPLYAGQVRITEIGLVRGYGDMPSQTISPAQDTVLWAGWSADMTGEIFGGPPTTMEALKADAAQAWIAFSIDTGPWLRADMSPFHSVCANGNLGGTNDVPLFHRTWGRSG